MIPIDTYNIRVYGLCVENEHILLMDEIHNGFRNGFKMTKFPGGGLEKGEGLEAALKREFMEEIETEIEVGDIYYVNPFLQISQFKQNEQLISLYFWVKIKGEIKGRFSDKKHDFLYNTKSEFVLRWVHLSKLSEEEMTFPVDVAVVKQLIDSKII